MPRARFQHKLIRIPVQPEVAYDLAYYYDPRKDSELLKKHADKLGELGKKLLELEVMKKPFTPKQRMALLKMEFPWDMRLKAIQSCVAKGSKKWEAKFRECPRAAYKEESDAELRAIRDIDCEAKLLEAVE